jgi:phenylacetate-CoA ligase
MRNLGLRIYGSLPYTLRVGVASIRGFRLRWQRYGADTGQLVAEALQREHWSAAQWTVWHNEQLSHLLHRAVTQVPYYREYWEKQKVESRKHKSRSDEIEGGWEKLQNWPVLEKEAVRQQPSHFLAEDVKTTRLVETHTSGSTGTPLTLWNTRQGEQSWYALFEARCRNWYGVSRRDRWAILGGQLVTPVSSRKPPFWVWNAGLSQLYMSTYHLAPDLIPHYLEALIHYRVRYVVGYPSALYLLAQTALEERRSDLRLQVVIGNAEPLYDHQRSVIAEAFQCPMRETYGMAEKVAAASECEHGRLHLWPEAGRVEVLNGGSPVEAGGLGDLVCTGLLNDAMPLIRYRVGDRGAMDTGDSECPCGRTLPRLAKLEGRSDDVLCTIDGRRIGRLDPVFKAGWPIREAQVIQESLDAIRVRLVPSDGFDDAIQQEVARQLQARLGNVAIEFEKVPEIPRGANGKFRSVICNLPPEHRPPQTE